MLNNLLAFLTAGTLISPLTNLSPNYTTKVQSLSITAPTFNFTTSVPLKTLSGVRNYLVYNLDTGEVYSASSSSSIISPASFTKLLTAAVVTDLLPADTLITVSSTWLGEPATILELIAGEQIPIHDLLRGSIATSGNDAAAVLAFGTANHLGLSNTEFIQLMNIKANTIGMSHSYFSTPNGLDDTGQHTTLEDMAKLVYVITKLYPNIVMAGQSDNQDIEANLYHQHHYLPNWNGLLGVYPGVNGLKIAYTETAGYSTIVTYNKDGFHFVAMVSGADSLIERDRAAANLLDAALIAEHQKPVRLSPLAIRKRYQEWNKLATQIRKAIKLL